MVNMPVGATIKTKAEAPGLFGAGIVEVAALMPASTSGFANRPDSVDLLPAIDRRRA
jgi:hypothetical protein